MYLLDTNIISEVRKKNRANLGVIKFLNQLRQYDTPVYLSVLSIGELRRGVDLIRHRGDKIQARKLENWLHTVLFEYAECILNFGLQEAQVWGRLRVPHPENSIDKQIAAIALMHELTVVTRNINDFKSTGVKLHNPFE